MTDKAESKNIGIKVTFGIIIFLFSIALAYFTASYVNNGFSPRGTGFWITLTAFSVIYILAALIASNVFPVSLGLLVTADILILNILFEEFGDIPSIYKVTILGVLLILLYYIAYLKLEDKNTGHENPTTSQAGISNESQPNPNPGNPLS